MGGSKTKKKQEDVFKPAGYVEDTAKRAIGMAHGIASQKFQPYTGERVAGLSANEQMGVDLAAQNVGVGQPYIDKSAYYTERGAQQFKDANMQDYISPYIKGALDPVARELREQGLRERNALDSRAAEMDAFGGSRAALLRSEAQFGTTQALSDLYAQGYQQAWDSAVQTWGGERARDLEAAGRFNQLGKDAVAIGEAEVANLMMTGLVDRNVQQAMRDFDYEQFITERDWDLRGLSALLASLQGVKGSTTTTQTSKSEVKESSSIADIVGTVAQVAGMAMMASDERLKDNLQFIKNINGINFYRWTWNAIAKSLGFDRFPTVGVIAQEVDDPFVVKHRSGFLMVNYRKLLSRGIQL